MEEFAFLQPLLLTITGLVIGALLKSLLKHSRFPYTVGLFAIGLLVGVLNRSGVFHSLPQITEAVDSVANINPDLILYLFLPILIFDAAYELNMHIFKKTLANATLLAAPGLVICMILTGVLMVAIGLTIPGYENWTWAFALMFGALISATDPVAVVALLHELKTSKRFSTLVDAESLLNDGTGIVCFMLFFGAYAATGATWTMGAMFAHTSGLPLNISIHGNDMDTQEHFFPGITTLGDILSEAGYSQTLMIGSEATFGGRRLYFTEHGHYDRIDHPYALEHGLLPEGYHVWWGYEDLYLFDFAKEKLEELSSQDTPFNLTMLTVDTHFEDGYVCSECQDAYGDDQYSNVMACSSRQLDEFLQWIQKQDFFEDTTIVLAGDHLTMDSNYCEDVAEDYERKAYVSYINPAVDRETAEERVYTTMDHFPTTLAAMGAQIEGDRLGLGTNLFSSTPTLAEMFGIDQVEQELQRKSELMEEMADIDKKTEKILKEEGRNPKADIQVEEYQVEEGFIPVTVSDIENVPTGVVSVQLAVWSKDDQSDLKWIQMEKGEDEIYRTQIQMSGFGYAEGEYKIHVYLTQGNSGQVMLGERVVMVN